MNEAFVGAFAQTIKNNVNSPNIKSFADHLLINKLISKQWICEQLLLWHKPRNVLLLGSWYPTYVPYILKANTYTCVDIDDTIWSLSAEFNNHLYGKDQTSKFRYITGDAQEWLKKDLSLFDTVINTSCEHMKFDMKDFDIQSDSMFVLTSNNYFEVKDHINCKTNLNDFVTSTGIPKLVYAGEKHLKRYSRYLVIGKYNENYSS